MRGLMGLTKDRHGTYYAQRKVPERLQEAVARVLNSEEPKQVYLKKSLGTKVLKEANVGRTRGGDGRASGVQTVLSWAA